MGVLVSRSLLLALVLAVGCARDYDHFFSEADGGNIAPCTENANTWVEQKATPLLAARTSGAAVVIGDTLYYLGGSGLDGRVHNDVYALTFGGGWRTVAPLQHPLERLAAVVVDGNIYVTGGVDTDGQSQMLVSTYDPSKNEWAYAKPTIGTHSDHAMAVGANGHAYLLDAGANNETFNGTSWSKFSDSADPRDSAVAMASNGGILLIGGRSESMGFRAVRDVDRLDVSNDTWDATPPMQLAIARKLAAAAVDRSGRIFVVGGVDETSAALESVETFDNGQWAMQASLPEARFSSSAVTGADGAIYVLGGKNAGSAVQDTVFTFCPSL